MELALNKEQLDYLRVSYRTCAAQEETAEAIVPDTQPDICKIIDVCTQPLLKSKEAEMGAVSVKGVVQTNVLYLAEDGGLYRIDTSVPYDVSAMNAEITQAAMVSAEVKVSGADASMVNPRKVVVRVSLRTDIFCFDKDMAELCCGVDDERVYEKLSSERMYCASECSEKTFVVADEFRIPDELSAADEILGYECTLHYNDYSFAGGKLIIRGVLTTELCWIPTDGGRPRRKSFASDFSQLVETENAEENAQADIKLMITSSYVDFNAYSQQETGRELVAEVHAVAQYIIFAPRETEIVEDMYSNGGRLEIEYKPLSYVELSEQNSLVCHVREELRYSRQGSELFAARMRFSEPAYSDGAYKLNAVVIISYFDGNGEMFTARGTINAQYECVQLSTPVNFGCKSLDITFGEETFAVSADIELLPDTLSQHSENNITNVSLEPFDDDTPVPSIIVYRVQSGDTSWLLAKKYRSSCKAIAEANKLVQDELPEPGQIILIPKA